MGETSKSQRLRLQALGAVVILLIQFGLGMFVNLFASIPRHHSGSQPSNYFSGSSRSVAWAIDHGSVSLVIHTILGFLVALMVIGAVARSISLGRGWITTWTVLGALATVGAGFNGLNFLDYNKNVSSFVMTILALAAVLCFAIVVYLPSEKVPSEVQTTPPN